MNTKIFAILFSLFLAMPFFVMAEDIEVVIPLQELVGSGNLGGGDNPLDNNGEIGNEPPLPNQFHATITGRTLAITVDNTNANRAIVRNVINGAVVMDTQFVGYTSNQLSASGNYVLEIHNNNLTLVGQFIAQ